MTTHHFSLQPKRLNLIASWEKTIEVRLYDPKRKLLNIGDTIIFSNTTWEHIEKTILDLKTYETFEKLYEDATPWSLWTNKEDFLVSLSQYYSQEDVMKYWTIAIYI